MPAVKKKNIVCNCGHPRHIHVWSKYCTGNKRDGGCKCKGFTTRKAKTIKRRKNKVNPEMLAEMTAK